MWDLVIEPHSVVWITSLTGEYANLFAAELIAKGYKVQAASGDHNLALMSPNRVSAVITVKIFHSVELKVADLVADVKTALANIKALYYSIIAVGTGGTAWGLGNLGIVEEGPDPKPKRNHLRLVESKENNNDNTSA